MVNTKYIQKLLNHVGDAFKTASKSAIQKTGEANGDLVGNEIADKITKTVTRKSITSIQKENTVKK